MGASWVVSMIREVCGVLAEGSGGVGWVGWGHRRREKEERA